MKKLKLFAMAVAALLCGTATAATAIEDLNFAITAATDPVPANYVLSSTNPPSIKTQNSIACVIISDGGGSTAPTFGTDGPTGGKRWMAFCPDADCSAEFYVMSNKKKFFIASPDNAEFFAYTNTANAPESVVVEGLKANTWYAMCGASSQVYVVSATFTADAPAGPSVKTYEIAGIDATVDQQNKTITAELPYGTDKTAAIQNATVTLAGTAKGYAYNAEYSILSVSDSAEVEPAVISYTLAITVKETASTDATLKSITVDATELSGFAADKYDYQMLASGLPVVAAVANDVTAKVDIEQATANPGTATITVTAQDGSTKLVYTVTFTSADKICGQLVKAVPTGKATGTISGGLPATVDVKLSGTADYEGLTGYKLNTTGAYFGFTLTQGTFKAGDVFNFFATACDGGKYAEIFTDKGTTSICVASEATVLGLNSIVLPAEAEGATSLYLYRTASNAYNATVAYIEVVRDCEPKLVAFSMANVDAVIDQELKTVTAVLPYGTVLTDNDWDNAYTLNGAATDAEYDAGHTTLTVNGEDTAIVYTLNITISQTPSSNFNLTEITVNSKAIADFRADSLTYAYELPNGTVDMPVIAAVAEDITAQVVVDEITALDQLVKIVVTAQDASTQTYTVQLSVASAPKYLYEAVFSNGAKGAIDNDAATVVVPYLDGTTYPTLVSDSVSAGATAAMEGEDKLIVTGSDMSTKEFSITFQALSAPSFVADTITFDGSESYIYAAYGWDAEKGVKFSKAVNEETNMRITTGKTRVYMALPACYKVNLISGTGGARDIKVSVNGADPVAMKTAAKNAGMDILLSTTEVNFVAIESAQTGGDGGFVKMVMTLDVPSGNEQIQGNIQENKFIYNGQFYMLNNGVLFNALGQELAK